MNTGVYGQWGGREAARPERRVPAEPGPPRRLGALAQLQRCQRPRCQRRD